jgi:hypothetical protein
MAYATGELGNSQERLRQYLEAESAAIAYQSDLFTQSQGPINALVEAQAALAANAPGAAEQVIAATDAIAGGYREMAFEAVLASQGVNESTLALGVQLGVLTQEQANARLEFVNTTAALNELTGSQEFARLTAEEQAKAIQAVIENANAFADGGPYVADVEAEVKGQGDLINMIASLNEIDGRHVRATAEVTTTNTQVTIPGVPDPKAGAKAGGGPVWGGSMYQVGEGNLPEFLKTKSGLYMIPGERGRVFSNADSRGMMGGQYTDNTRITIVNQTREAAALAMANVQLLKKAKMNSYMGAR